MFKEECCKHIIHLCNSSVDIALFVNRNVCANGPILLLGIVTRLLPRAGDFKIFDVVGAVCRPEPTGAVTVTPFVGNLPPAVAPLLTIHNVLPVVTSRPFLKENPLQKPRRFGNVLVNVKRRPGVELGVNVCNRVVLVECIDIRRIHLNSVKCKWIHRCSRGWWHRLSIHYVGWNAGNARCIHHLVGKTKPLNNVIVTRHLRRRPALATITTRSHATHTARIITFYHEVRYWCVEATFAFARPDVVSDENIDRITLIASRA